jgi:ankyrin repeat protein
MSDFDSGSGGSDADAEEICDAIREKDFALVKKLVGKKGYTVENIGNDDPLQVACEVGNLEIVEYLIEKYAEKEWVYPEDDCEHWLLANTLQYGNADVVKFLLEKGANTKGEFIAECYIRAVENDHFEAVKTFLEIGNIDVAGEDENGESWDCDNSALRHAIANGNMEMVKLLIKHGADVNDYEEDYGEPAALRAAVNAFGHCCDCIGENEENVENIKKKKCFEMIKYLVEECGAQDFGALDFSINTKDIELVKYLVEKGIGDTSKLSLYDEKIYDKIRDNPEFNDRISQKEREIALYLVEHGATYGVKKTKYDHLLR